MATDENLLEEELKLLRRYRHGRDLVEGDRKRLEELRLIGFVAFGVSFRRRVVTVKTVGLGLKIIGEEKPGEAETNHNPHVRSALGRRFGILRAFRL